MTKRDEIQNIIIESIEKAKDYELAYGYNEIVSCGDCPYWHDCRNEHECDDYILDKLQEDKEDDE